MNEELLVVDDEPQMLIAINETLRRRGYCITTAGSGVEALCRLKEKYFRLVITDMRMPEVSGLDLLRKVKNVAPQTPVILLTAYGTIENAVDAMRNGAFDYLLKPLDIDDLSRVLMRYEKKNNSVQQVERIQALMSNLGVGSEIQNRIALPTPTGYRMERLSNIVYCQADENYSIIHTISGESILVTKTLKALEDIFPAGHFFRIHKSFLINLNFVKEYSRGEEHYVLLEDGTSLEVATRRHDEFVRMLTQRKT